MDLKQKIPLATAPRQESALAEIITCPECGAPLRSAFEERAIRKGEILFLEGDPPRWLYLVHQGKVLLLKEQPDGTRTIVNVCGKGDFVGEMDVLDGRPYSVTAEALTNGVVLRMRREAFWESLRASPMLSERVIRALASRLRETQEFVRILTTDRVEKRIAAILLALADRFGTPTEEGIRLDPSFSRYSLAAMGGTTVETTVRVLSRWAEEGIIVKHRREIIITDPQALVQLLEDY